MKRNSTIFYFVLLAVIPLVCLTNASITVLAQEELTKRLDETLKQAQAKGFSGVLLVNSVFLTNTPGALAEQTEEKLLELILAKE